MYNNSTISENLYNFRDYAVSGINYSVSGIAAHFTGTAVEIASIYLLQGIPYLKWIKFPIAKILHEMTENFFSSSATINLKNDNGLFDTLKKITEPVWNYPGETVTAMMFSYLSEQFGIKYLGLTECNHNNPNIDIMQPGAFAQAFNHNNCKSKMSHITDEILKGMLSIAGSYFGARVYNAFYLYENKSDAKKVETESNIDKITEKKSDDISKSEIINTQDLKVPKDLNDNELKCVSETMYDFAKIILENPVDITSKLDKVLESDLNIETTLAEMTSEDVPQSVDI